MTAKVKKIVKEAEVKVPFLLTNFLTDRISVLKVPTYGDIQKFKTIQEILGSIHQELQAKIKEILDKHDLTEVSPEHERYEEVNKEYQELLKGDSSISREELQVFTKEDFERVYNGSNLTVNDALSLEYWLVK